MVSSAATVDAVTSRPTSAYTPAVMRMSCISAISTGTANFHWNRSPMYIEMTASDAMMATSAEFAIDWPNVGPIEVDDDCTSPYCRRSADSTRLTWSGLSCDVEIWKTCLPSCGSWTLWTSTLEKPCESIVDRTC